MKFQEPEEYGKIPFDKAIKILVDIIGQNVILYLEGEKYHKSNKGKLQRMNEGKMSYQDVLSLQKSCEHFFKVIEVEYNISPLVTTSFVVNLKSVIWDFSLYADSNVIVKKSKKDIALFLLQGKAFHFIDYVSSEKNLLSDLPGNVFKTTEKNVLMFLTDSYKKIFDEIMQIFKNKEAFYEEIANEIRQNPKTNEDLDKEKTSLEEKYRQNIDNWQNEDVYNPNWRTFAPVLNYLHKHNHISFVYRLLGLYLRKNIQKVFTTIFDISEDELKEIIVEIVDMIKNKKHLDKFPSDLYYDIIWFDGQRIRITMCLEYQNNYENSADAIKSNEIINYLGHNYYCSSEGKFLYFWLQARSRVFDTQSDLKDNSEPILTGYKKALEELDKDIKSSPFLTQFLLEAIILNDFLYPRRVAKRVYYEYGITHEVFNKDKLKRDDILKISRNEDIRETLVDIHRRFCTLKINKSYFNKLDAELFGIVPE